MPSIRVAVLVVAVTLTFSGPAGIATAASTTGTGTTGPGTTGTGTTGTGTTGTGTTGTGTTGTTTAGPRGESSSSSELLAAIILVLGATGVAFAYFFYNGWRTSYEKLTQSALNKTGHLPQIEFNPVESHLFRVDAVAQQDAGQQPVVKGPAAVVVGEGVSYKATLGGAPAAACAWAVQPADAGTVQPAAGAETTLTALKEGPLVMTATVPAEQPTLVPVTALAKVTEGRVPLIGLGFASVAAAIVAFAIAGALTALGNLSGAAFIAFLGPVVGYFFAQASGSGSSGGSTKPAGGTGGTT
jgi:hypothetical protein